MAVPNEIRYFRRERLLFKIGGISLEEKESFIYKMYSRTIILLIFIACPILNTLDLSNRDFNDTGREWFYALLALMDSVILLNVFFNRRSFENALRTFEMPSFYASEVRGSYDDEKRSLQDWLTVSVRQNYTFTISAILACGGHILYSLVSRMVKSDPNDWILPFGSITLVNFRESPNFEIIWFYESVMYIIYITNVISLVMIIVGSLSFLTVQLKMLQSYLRRIIDLAKERTDQETSINPCLRWKDLNQFVSCAVEYHLDIINATNAIGRVLHMVFLTVFMFTLNILCVNIYRASLLRTTDVTILEIIGESLVALFPTLVICFYGEKLTHESEQVGIVAYQMDFVGTSVRFQKSLILLIARSQNVLQIKAGDMIGASMTTALWIIRSAYSACMMLRTVNAKEEVEQN